MSYAYHSDPSDIQATAKSREFFFFFFFFLNQGRWFCMSCLPLQVAQPRNFCEMLLQILQCLKIRWSLMIENRRMKTNRNNHLTVFFVVCTRSSIIITNAPIQFKVKWGRWQHDWLYLPFFFFAFSDMYLCQSDLYMYPPSRIEIAQANVEVSLWAQTSY